MLPPQAPYGSDRNGLICGFLFERGGRGVPVDLERALQWLQAPEFFDALHEGSRSTRIEDASHTLVAVVNDVAFEFAFDPSEIASLWVNVGPRIAVSARIHPLRSIERLRQSPVRCSACCASRRRG